MMTSVTSTCRDINELTKAAQLACRLLFQECYKAGIKDIFITETYRSQERQNYLYAQGRTRPGQVVTWTKSSNHKSRLAWDIAVAPPKSLYDVATLNKVGAIAKKLNITWGGTWTNNLDRPHFEIHASWGLPKGYELEGEVIIPTTSSLKVQLIVEDKEEEEVAKTWNPGSAALKEGAESLLREASEKGLINKSHLADLQNGNMTTDRLIGLVATVIDRGVKL